MSIAKHGFCFCLFSAISFSGLSCPYIKPCVMFLVSPMLFSMVSILFVLNVSVWGFLFLILQVVVVVVSVVYVHVISSLPLSKINLVCLFSVLQFEINYAYRYWLSDEIFIGFIQSLIYVFIVFCYLH